MNDPVRVGVSSVLSRSPSSARGAWVWNLGVPVKDRGLDTLLGFEDSAGWPSGRRTVSRASMHRVPCWVVWVWWVWFL
jgi:hypothetical protein